MLAAAVVASTVFRIQDAALDEASSLLDLGSVMVTANDSGHPPVLYVLDGRTGATRRTVRYAVSQTDVEALAPAERGAVWVGDIGENLAHRREVTIRRVPLDGGPVASYRLRYPDGPHDAEALLVARHRLWVVTKGVFGGHAYAVPRRLDAHGTNRLRRAGPTLPGLVTDAATFGDGRHVLLRTYGDAFVYAVPSWRRLGSFALPRQRHGEGVSIGPGDRIRIGSEGRHSRVLQVSLPSSLRAHLHPAAERSDAGPQGRLRSDAPADGTPWWPWVAGASALGLAAAAATAIARHRPGGSAR